MQMLYEGHPAIESQSQGWEFIQTKPEVLPEPVFKGATDTDGIGVSIYGSVLEDGGRFRMWYQAWPKNWDATDSVGVGYAESEDGITWARPKLGLIESAGSGDNNLTDLPFHCPSVFVDPAAPSHARYRATGYATPAKSQGRYSRIIRRKGYFSAHSSDGLHWEIDNSEPTWEGADVITSAYDLYHSRIVVALKRSHRFRGIPRRSVFLSVGDGTSWSDPVRAVIPDEYDDVMAQAHGMVTGDYYGMGLMPTETATVGFLWQFRHQLPLTRGSSSGVFGHVDVSLTYQIEPGGRWLHFPGRPDWLAHGEPGSWSAGGIYTSSYAIHVGDETRLYFTGTPHPHGWYLDDEWKLDKKRRALMHPDGFSFIGLAKWPRGRLLGFHAPVRETMHLRLGDDVAGKILKLNAQTFTNGAVRVELLRAGEPMAGYSLDDCEPFVGDLRSGTVRWKAGERLPENGGAPLMARIQMDMGTIYGFEVAE